MANYELGHPPKKGAPRDATHVAIVPVISAEDWLSPGAHVGIMKVEGKPITAAKSFSPHIGIVDPFLKKHYSGLKKGQPFYLCLYPGTVTGLAHVYTHPELDGPSVEGSKAWIELWASKQKVDFIDLMEHAEAWVQANQEKMNYDGYWSEGGRFEGQDLPKEFWDHYEKVMGVKVPAHAKENFFSCSC